MCVGDPFHMPKGVVIFRVNFTSVSPKASNWASTSSSVTHSGSSRTSPRSRHWTSHRSTSRFAARSSFEMGFSGDLLILISVCLTIIRWVLLWKCWKLCRISRCCKKRSSTKAYHIGPSARAFQVSAQASVLPELLPPFPQAPPAPFAFAASLRSLSAFWQRPPRMVSRLVSAAKSESLWKASRGQSSWDGFQAESLKFNALALYKHCNNLFISLSCWPLRATLLLTAGCLETRWFSLWCEKSARSSCSRCLLLRFRCAFVPLDFVSSFVSRTFCLSRASKRPPGIVVYFLFCISTEWILLECLHGTTNKLHRPFRPSLFSLPPLLSFFPPPPPFCPSCLVA